MEEQYLICIIILYTSVIILHNNIFSIYTFMEDQQRGSPRGSPRGSSRGSSRSSSRSSSEVGVNEPQMGDGPEMLLWRATVDPLRNVGSPISAVWAYTDEPPNTADENRNSIRTVDRFMFLIYPGGGWGEWTPGEAVENVYYLMFPPETNQSWRPRLEASEYEHYQVYHSTNIPLGKGYNSQYVSPSYSNITSVSELDPEYVRQLARELYGKGKNYIRGYIKRYFVTPTFSDEYDKNADNAARNTIVDIFVRLKDKRFDEVENFVEDEWDILRNQDSSDYIFFDENLYKDNINVRLINRKGQYLRPANNAEAVDFIREGVQFTPTFKLPLSPNSKPITRKRSQRRRDKKLLKNELAYLESIKNNPYSMYGDDEDRVHKELMTRLHDEMGKKVKDKTEKSELIKQMYGHYGGLRTTRRRRKYKHTTRKFRGKKQIK